MPLTQVQIQNLAKLDAKTSIEILHECVENLGLCSVGYYHELTGMNKRTIYDHIQNGKLKSTKISEQIYIIINDKGL